MGKKKKKTFTSSKVYISILILVYLFIKHPRLGNILFSVFISSMCVCLMLAYSILGMNLFGGKFCKGNCTDPDDDCDRKNFDSLLWATVTVFQVSTTTTCWHQFPNLIRDLLKTPPPRLSSPLAPFFFF